MTRSNRLTAALAILSLATLPVFAAGKGKGMSNNYNNKNNNQTQNQTQVQTQNQNQQPPQQQQPIDTTQVKSAQSDLAAARDDQKKAEAALADIVRRLQATFDSSGLMKTAMEQLRSAQGGYEAASKVVVDKLANNADYKKAVADRTAADAKAIKLRQDGGSPEDINASLNDALAKAAVVTKLQQDAINADTPASEAKAKLAAANQQIAELRKQFTDSLKDNPEWAAARKTVDDAKDKVKTCESALADAQKALAQQQAARARGG